MDILKYLQDCLLVIFLVSIHHGYCLFDDDYDEATFGRCPSIRNKLKNGRVRYRYKGRVAKFQCDSGYELAGKRSSTCVRGYWTNPIPVCVARGCSRVPPIANGRVVEMYRGALLIYDCNPGYTLVGDISIHCDGRRWNASPPACGVNPNIMPDSTCDFEDPYLCGWTHDPTHDFDWKRNQFSTPSGHVGTGPSYDHTFGKNKAGFYLYIEASSPRKINDTARLFSPVFPPQQSGGCFLFWYHMYGATTGGLRVFFKPESHVFGELSPKWEKFGNQGDHWLRGNISVPSVNENFQIVIEGIRGETYVGDSAIDDVQLTQSDCQAMENETATQDTDANSCRGRCRTPKVEDACECQDSCIGALNCCGDYTTLCTTAENPQQQTNEPEPGDYYGKTPTPLTIPATLSSITAREKQTSTESLNVTSQFTSQSSISSQGSFIAGTTSAGTVTPEVLTSPPLSSMLPTTDSTSSPVAMSTKLEPVTVTSKVTLGTKSPTLGTKSPSTSPPTTTPKYTTTVSEEKLKTTDKIVTSSSTQSVKPSSSTKTTVMASTRSTVKRTTNAPKSSQSTNIIPNQSTTTTTTQRSTTTSTQRSTTTTTQRSTTTVKISTTTTPKSTTRSSTTTTPMSTTQSSTTTTSIPTTQSSTTTTPVYTTITSSTTPTTSTTTTTTTLKPISVPVTQTNSPLSSVSTTTVFSSISSSSTVPGTTTPRYNLRPRKSTTISSYSTAASSFSSTKTSTLKTTTSKTETSTKPSEISSTPQSRRWFNFTALRSTATVSSPRISTTTVPVRTSAKVQYVTGSKYSYRLPISTTTVYPTTSDSYDMANSKRESPKSSDNSSVIITVALLAIICIVGGAVFYIRWHRLKRQSKLDDDSELRFLPENDCMEYSDASVLDRILTK